MIQLDEWDVDYKEDVEDAYWIEKHKPKSRIRVEIIEIGEYKTAHWLREKYLNKPFLMFIDVLIEGNFSSFGGREKYKKHLSKLFPEISKKFSPEMCGVFYGFNTIREMMEYTEKIKEMIENDEV